MGAFINAHQDPECNLVNAYAFKLSGICASHPNTLARLLPAVVVAQFRTKKDQRRWRRLLASLVG